MTDIFHYFPIRSSIDKVFEAISIPTEIDKWWTKKSSGVVKLGETYQLHFDSGYNWIGIVSKYIPNKEFELTIQNSEKDWNGSKVGFNLFDKINETEVQFYHTGWAEDNEHVRISNFCWAMYLRLLKRNLEFGEFVSYADRLNV